MAVIAQRNDVRMIAFQKCGHTSIINMFLTPADMSLVRGTAPALGAPAVRNSGDEAAAIDAFRGDAAAAQKWPPPRLTIAFFRNPLMRALSAYQHFIVRTLREELSTQGQESFLSMGFTADMDFAAFCKHLQTIDLTRDPHITPQALSFNEAYDGEETHAGQLEQLTMIWPLMVDHYGLDCTKEVPRYNEARYMVTEHMSEESVAIIKQLYNTDHKYWEAAYFEARAPFSSVYH